MWKNFRNVLQGLFLLCGMNLFTYGQTDSLALKNDSINNANLLEYDRKLAEVEKERLADSLKKAELEAQLLKLKTTDNLQKIDLIQQLETIKENEKRRIANKIAQIDSLKNTAKGYPVLGFKNDTLFYIYTKMGAASPKERAVSISNKINQLYQDDFLIEDSIRISDTEETYDIVYKDLIIASVSENDALWYGKSKKELSENFQQIIKSAIVQAKDENSWLKLLSRIGLVFFVMLVAWVFIGLIGKGYTRLVINFDINKEKWLQDLSYKDYTFLTVDQETQILLFLIKVLRWFVYFLLLYITLPIIFSIFPFSRDWANTLFYLIWSPFKGLLISIWTYIPNLFKILVIYFVMKYVIKFVKYIFQEIEAEKLVLSDFHSDWAMPTFSIVQFLLYAFMFVLIFPYLPGSESAIFKGVSVFVGVLFSLGSSSAISNMVAGLVITYMRPFKIGDRIKIDNVTGDIIEKTLLVTRVRTIKNEVITIPNSSVLTENTTNYSIEAKDKGLIVNTTVTIGYDVPWPKVHKVLIEAARRTDMIMDEPAPYVLQTSLEDFYVAYQINAYTREASKQALIYSSLHQNIQDVCNESDIEILSPHYRAARDGNMTTIPADYLPKDYKVPHFNVKLDKGKEEQ
ncbi:mechanosensitive ion channel domain-containing protein [Cyclobacterium amurskyense]|uniref:Mechanosensitive ion channel family protein n=1 Tax=Cyclobacterium amurskyense TaxID=320787 RepID=A0A0H4PE80_9BACT|nr:mechanosensitive ion channel domain-containing protein [Cyclobacterium amurskyense]AKP51113.1 Mechanosensitive ion channel family protein [Cyclobacterium amurskyense]|tara:strand:- start:767 stop:2653 length:1887 start_codon:yes stop_codon:yes gene_type:complete